MRLLTTLFLLVACGLGQAAPSIRVQPGGWGGASAPDIEAVLVSVAEAMLADFQSPADMRIVVTPTNAGPRVLAQKSPDGAYRVELSAKDTRWDQFAYQFSHELCHILSNFDHREIGEARHHQWFEEAVCEAASIVALDRVAERWQRAAPYAAWREYAPAFREYARRLEARAHRHLPAGSSLAAWYRENSAALARDPYLREKNELVATALVKLFRSAGLQPVAYLNMDRQERDFRSYLAAWFECCPEAHRPVVRRILELFET